jgi:hypothetical protein
MLGQKITINLHTSKHWELYSEFINRLEEYEEEETRKREEMYQRMAKDGRLPQVGGIAGGFGVNPLVPQRSLNERND